MPLEQDFAIEKKEVVYENLPDGMYNVELFDISVKEQPKFNEPETLEKVFTFQYIVLNEGEYRGRCLWANFIPTFLYVSTKNGKNKLYQIVESLNGELTQEQEAKMNTSFLTSLIGKQCQVMVEIKTKGDKSFNNIMKWLPLKTYVTPATKEEKEKAVVKNKSEDKGYKSFPNNIPQTQNRDSNGVSLDQIPF